MKKKFLNFINFAVNVDELIHLKSRTLDNKIISDKDLISVGGFYFLYWFNRSNVISTYDLREITQEEYLLRKKEWLNDKFKQITNNGELIDGENSFLFEHFACTYWKRNVPAADCTFFSENSALKTFYNAMLEKRKNEIQEEDSEIKKAKYEYSYTCGALSTEHNVEFVNVLQIGHNVEELLEFKRTYENAIDFVYSASLVDKRHYYRELFQKQQTARKVMLNTLGVKTFGANVQCLDLEKIEKVLLYEIDKYIDDSKIIALDNIEEMNLDECKEVYSGLMSSNTSKERKALSALGIIPEALDIKRFSCTILKAKLLDKINHAT